jgi:hypothetical protein
MEAPPKPEFAYVNGQQIRITYCPAVRGSRDLNFDRWSFDNAGQAPELGRSDALSLRSNWQSGDNVLVMGKNGRVRPKKQQ